eukprot:TRINITY_DN3910_c0_g1_i1.p1 TRINITY_DN3910_c0_g1~~TRINITY_DN3910_c0_g1_i1.p1  ORF type:complete len:1031 (+),score=256.92 TRINITY_DN3910_c0_g1_i1:478-3570(+)
MTYDFVQTNPGPRLNLVIGPNGTGKSSIVCALCVGLAGDPKLLGRAVNIGEFVQRGHEKGSVTITLRGHNPNKEIKIFRGIGADNSSEWKINGRPAKLQDVKKVTSDFNIQVGNLTQFLPQDRVCEFAKLSAVELLVETQKAVGDPQLRQKQEALIENKNRRRSLIAALTLSENTKATMEKENSELFQDVERVKKRDEKLEKVKRMEKKEAVLKIKKAEHLQAAKEAEIQVVNATIQELKRKFDESQAPVKQAKAVSMKAISQLGKLRKEMAPLEAKFRELEEEKERLTGEVMKKKGQITSLEKAASSRKQRLEDLEAKLASAQEEAASFPPPSTPTPADPELARLRAEEHDTVHQKVAIEQKLRDVGHEIAEQRRKVDEYGRRLEDARSWKGKIITALKGMDRHMAESLEWIRLNKDKLKSTVFGPVASEVQVTNPLHARYLEQAVGQNVWRTFITTCQEDRDLLNTNLRADVVNDPGRRSPERTNHGPPADRLRSLGVMGTLDEVFTTNDVVRYVIRKSSNVDRVYYGTVEADQRSDEVGALSVSSLYTPTTHYSWRGSRYHSYITSEQREVRQCRIFSTTVSPEEIAQMQRNAGKAEGDLEELGRKKAAYEAERDRLDALSATNKLKAQAIQRKQREETKRASDVHHKVGVYEKQLAAFHKELEEAAGIEHLRKQISDHNLAICKAVRAAYGVAKEMALLHMRTAPYELLAPELEGRVRVLEEGVKGDQNALNDATRNKQKLEMELKAVKTLVEKRVAEAQAVLGVRSPAGIGEACNALKDEWKTFPHELEALRIAMEEEMAEANGILCADPHVIQRYKEREVKIKQEAEVIAKKSAEVEKLNQDIEAVKNLWLPHLRMLVGKINETFGRNFEQMAVAGEVCLDEHGLDFDLYGILIKVKFRQNADLRVLSAQHQSGGERSVATILYLVALQAITQCPFRVVDEINQGMDPVNERKMFQQLVRAASQPNTPQCFLLTPKLLSDLDYGCHCTVLNVMNGPYVAAPSGNEALRSGSSYLAALRCLEAQA